MSGDDDDRCADDTGELDALLQLVARAEPRPVPGGLIAGRFRVRGVAGRGGFGTVYRAHDEVAGLDVALKVLRDGTTDVARFERETEFLATLRHPNVVSYVAHGLTDDGAPFLAMEWLQGVDLSHWLGGEPVNLLESLLIARCAAQGLGAAHSLGIVHRDVKPSNLYLARFSPGDVRVIDFGVARAPGSRSALTTTGAVIGTPAYMAPEQARGARDLSPSADVFALGCVLFECLTGEPPFTAPTAAGVMTRLLRGEVPDLVALRADTPLVLGELVARMLAPDPDDRVPDGAAVAANITAVLGHPTCASVLMSGGARFESAPVVQTSPWGSLPLDRHRK